MLKNIDIEIKSGQVVALMGPSGSGKSTLIKIISSFLEPTEGKILIDNRPVKVNSPYSSLSYVSQSSVRTLFPWFTVEKNIYYPCKLRKIFNNETKAYCDKLLDTLKIKPLRKKYPLNLSGGQEKRLSLAVALSYNPKIILIDEPFSGIDFKLTEELWDVLYNDFKERKPTVFFVTHSLDEASILADKVFFLKNSKGISIPEKSTPDFKDTCFQDFTISETTPRYKLLAHSSIVNYKSYLLNEFNDASNE